MSHDVRGNLKVFGSTEVQNQKINGILTIEGGAFTDATIRIDVNGHLEIVDQSGTIKLTDIINSVGDTHAHANSAVLDATTASFTTELETDIGNAVTHLADTANPHATDLGNLGTGTIGELNALITDLTATYGGVRDIGVGTIAQRPAFGTADRFWWATDELSLSRDTGTSWEEMQVTPDDHASTHLTGGSDAIQLATDAQDGLMSQAYATKLDEAVVYSDTSTAGMLFTTDNSALSDTLLLPTEGAVIEYVANELADALASRRFIDETVGDGATNPITINHDLGVKHVQVIVVDNATDQVVTADVTLTDTNNISIDFGTAPALNAYTVRVIA